MIESRAGVRRGRFPGYAAVALCVLLLAGLLLVAGSAAAATADDDLFAEARVAMVRAVALDAERTAEWIGKEELSPA